MNKDTKQFGADAAHHGRPLFCVQNPHGRPHQDSYLPLFKKIEALNKICGVTINASLLGYHLRSYYDLRSRSSVVKNK